MLQVENGPSRNKLYQLSNTYDKAVLIINTLILKLNFGLFCFVGLQAVSQLTGYTLALSGRCIN
jgi:hypothetical protein